MQKEEVRVLERVYTDVNQYDWKPLDFKDEYYKSINFPIDAEKPINAYFAEVMEDLVVIVGAYKSRFYYEEESYSWEKVEYASMVSTLDNVANNAFFMTSEDYKDYLKAESMYGFGLSVMNRKQDNVISSIYNIVNKKASGIGKLYTNFLNRN